MREVVIPAKIGGQIDAPSSKSEAQRAIILAALSKGESWVFNSGDSEDVLSVITLAKNLGATVENYGDKLTIAGNLSFNTTEFFCGESGLATRVFSCLATLTDQSICITGKGSLLKRSTKCLEEALSAMNISFRSQNGNLPIWIEGKWNGGSIRLNGSETSQILSGLLIACPLAEGDTTIVVDNLNSKSYVELTIQMIHHFGGNIEHHNLEQFFIRGNQHYIPTSITIEGDWSGAAFLMVAAALAGEIKITNLNVFSKQPDKNILTVLMQSGAILSVNDSCVEIKRNRNHPFFFDATHCPDLIPPVVALAAHCEGESIIRGASRLINKESNRALALVQEFQKMGIKILWDDDVLVVYGGSPTGAICHSHNDHRIAMACAVAGLKAKGETFIEDADVVKKSFPKFFSVLRSLMR